MEIHATQNLHDPVSPHPHHYTLNLRLHAYNFVSVRSLVSALISTLSLSYPHSFLLAALLLASFVCYKGLSTPCSSIPVPRSLLFAHRA